MSVCLSVCMPLKTQNILLLSNKVVKVNDFSFKMLTWSYLVTFLLRRSQKAF